MKRNEEQLEERESTVEGRERAAAARESEVEAKDQEADEKLLEAKNERNTAEKLLEQVKGIKNNLARRWELILNTISKTKSDFAFERPELTLDERMNNFKYKSLGGTNLFKDIIEERGRNALREFFIDLENYAFELHQRENVEDDTNNHIA